MELQIDYTIDTSIRRRYGFIAFFMRVNDGDMPCLLEYLEGYGHTKEEAAENLRVNFLKEKDIINSVVII